MCAPVIYVSPAVYRRVTRRRVALAEKTHLSESPWRFITIGLYKAFFVSWKEQKYNS
jgi:hypothetical protein